jgi:hypothetical protein
MTAKIKTIFLLVFILLVSVNKSRAQKLLYIDFCTLDQDNAFLYDTIDLFVHVVVDDTSLTNDDTIFGDIYFWWQSDSMVDAGAPPRLINTNLSPQIITVGGSFIAVKLDIRPEEYRFDANGDNSYCIWPAMQSIEISDTGGCGSMNCNPHSLGTTEFFPKSTIILYPNPTSQFLFIESALINSIKEITLMSLEGKIVCLKTQEEIKAGRIDLEFLQPGIYFVELKMPDNSIVRKKIQKQ